MGLSNWGDFWQAEEHSFDEVMRLATTHFAYQIIKVADLKPGNEIFDYGCGPGFLADVLEAKQLKTAGADLNSSFIDRCRKKHPLSQFIKINTDMAENKRLLESFLGEKKFDVIVLLSVVQYFRNVNEVEEVITMLSLFLKEKGKIIIADVIDDNTSSMQDAVALLRHCWQKGKVQAFLRFMTHLVLSPYRRLSQNVSLLAIPSQAMEKIAANNILSCQKVDGLTLHPSRTSYILTKS